MVVLDWCAAGSAQGSVVFVTVVVLARASHTQIFP